MSIVVDDAVAKVDDTLTVIEASGSSFITGAYGKATSPILLSNRLGTEFIDLSVSFTCFSAPSGSLTLGVYARPLAVDGVASHDAPVPASTFQQYLIGTIPVSEQTTLQYQVAEMLALPLFDCEIYLKNETGATISNTWTAAYRARTVGPLV